MKKKVLALFLTLAMAVSLVTPAIATEPEEEPTLAQTVQTLFTTLLDLYKEENAGDAGLILAALARDEDGNLPEDPELPGDFTLPELTKDDLDTPLRDIFTEDQVKEFQTLLDEEAQAEEEPSIEEEPVAEEEPDAEAPSSEEEPAGEETDAEEVPSEEEPAAEEPAQEEEISLLAFFRSPVSDEEEVTAAELTLQETFDLLAARHAAGDYTAVTAILTVLTVQEEEPEAPGEGDSQEPTGDESDEEEPAAEEPVEGEPEIPLNPVPPLDLILPTCTCEKEGLGYIHAGWCPRHPKNMTNEQALLVWQNLSDQEKESAKKWFTKEQLEYIMAHENSDGTVFQAETQKGKKVQVTGKIPKGVQLVVNDLDPTVLNGEDTPNFDFGDQPYVGLDIKMLDENNAEWQPTSGESVTVAVDTPNFKDGDQVSILHCHEEDDGSVTEENLGLYTVNNGQVIFEMSRFSFILISGTTAQFGNVASFYPATLQHSSSINGQQVVLAFYYDMDGNAHMILTHGSASKQVKTVTINNNSPIIPTQITEKPGNRTTTLEFYSSSTAISNSLVGTVSVEGPEKQTGIYDVNLGKNITLSDKITVSVDLGSPGHNVDGDEYVLTLNYSIKKTVINGNAISDDTAWEESVTAEKGSVVIYKIVVSNLQESNIVLNGTVSDVLPDGVFTGPIELSSDGTDWQPVTLSENEFIVDSNVSLSPGEANTYYVKATVDSNLSITEDKTYVNTATISGQGLVPDSSTASVRIEAPKTGDLTIKKEGNITDDYQSFIFDVKQGDTLITTVTIQGTGSVTIKDLPLGEYIVEERTGWSWRYEPDDGTTTQSVELTADHKNESVTFNNSRAKESWLTGHAFAVNNWNNSNANERTKWRGGVNK